jgi:osmotically-inducible protein OsmY
MRFRSAAIWRTAAIWIATFALAGAGAAADASVKVRQPSEREAALAALLVEKLGDDAATIAVALSDRGRVALTGAVEERVTQELAPEVAFSFGGVTSVSNRVEARKAPRLPDGQLMREGQDAELERRVEKAVRIAVPEIARGVEIEVADGVVAVRGIARDATVRARLLETVRDVPDVTWIIDLVRVGE